MQLSLQPSRKTLKENCLRTNLFYIHPENAQKLISLQKPTPSIDGYIFIVHINFCTHIHEVLRLGR